MKPKTTGNIPLSGGWSAAKSKPIVPFLGLFVLGTLTIKKP